MSSIKELISSVKTNIWNSRIDKNPNIYNEYLKSIGINIGDNVLFVKPSSNSIDTSAPCLISIGNNVCISKGVTLFVHDYSAFVQRNVTGEVLGGVDGITIGNNIQIGADVTILMGTIIKDNVIIAAGAVCKGILESGFVYGGVPARKIQSIGDFITKRRKDQLREATNLALSYYKKYQRFPDEKFYYPFHLFPVFLHLNDWPESFWKGFGQKLSKQKILDFYKDYKPQFSCYRDFLESIEEKYVKKNH